MTNIKNVVKVMNFHSLLRVDKAKKKADKFRQLETEIEEFMSIILNNQNLNLDHKILNAKPDGKIINIYIGNDLGFCGNFNSSIKHEALNDTTSLKIMVGKKIFIHDSNTVLNISKEDLYKSFTALEDIIKPLLEKKEIKEINCIFIRYVNINNMHLDKTRLFPIEPPKLKDTSDFVIEADGKIMFTDLILLYIDCKLQIIESNSWASENIQRENLTNESLRKIDEIEEEKLKIKRKEKRAADFKKQLANYRKES